MLVGDSCLQSNLSSVCLLTCLLVCVDNNFNFPLTGCVLNVFE